MADRLSEFRAFRERMNRLNAGEAPESTGHPEHDA
jgi:hypothetical protein